MNEETVVYKSKMILAVSNNDAAGAAQIYNEYYNYFYSEGNPYYGYMLDELMYLIRDTLYKNNKTCEDVCLLFDAISDGIVFQTEEHRLYSKFLCKFKFATDNTLRKELIKNIEPVCPDELKRELTIYKLDIANSELNIDDISSILNYLKSLDNSNTI